MSKGWVPEAGELITIDFNSQAGREQAGRRPASVVSPAMFNALPAHPSMVCPIMSQVKGYPFEVALPPGLKITGVILSDHLKSVDWRARKAKRVDLAPTNVLETVRQHVSLILGIE